MLSSGFDTSIGILLGDTRYPQDTAGILGGYAEISPSSTSYEIPATKKKTSPSPCHRQGCLLGATPELGVGGGCGCVGRCTYIQIATGLGERASDDRDDVDLA